MMKVLRIVEPLSRSLARSASSATGSKTHFGFQNVTEEEKAEKVFHVFENVATKYDLMNDTMSFGTHRLWKDYFVDKLGPMSDISLLDMAGGTGDIAARVARYIRNNDAVEPTGRIVIGDINPHMLEVGRRKLENANLAKGLEWVEADAEKLPFDAETFDAYTIAFGIRNCVHVQKVIDEAYRVLRPGGRFMCLEFSRVNNALLEWLYEKYSFEVIPVMGQLIAGDWESYQYLVESIRKFPDQGTFAEMIRSSGFRAVNYENLTSGVVAIHSGFKL
ncbi:unnamed protein product [Notodromas monacha]|uniref:2-methoxy-6-polyprenyl-1,4-benzoquinol methylase, mitochondrial n=1 Tax=Notodromas monacha TaxID=399045 RepID=A0A7R9BIU4_9CRUS|nr:unnamed protein product [Notodromas monacha]CAG0916312.1 unnamed protein product [Notodromas monacha]